MSDKITNTKLLAQQELFCVEYVAQNFNGTQAAIAAGYSKRSAKEQARRLLTYDHVQQKVKELLQHKIKATNVNVQRVLSELVDIAFSDTSDAFNDDGTIRPLSEWPEGLRKAISTIEVNEIWDGYGKDRTQCGVTKKVKFWSKDKAIEQLGRYLQMFVDKMEVTTKVTLESMIEDSFSERDVTPAIEGKDG